MNFQAKYTLNAIIIIFPNIPKSQNITWNFFFPIKRKLGLMKENLTLLK
jgi:hypothetical protein